MSGRRHGPWRARFEDLKEAYVLHALSEDERQEFEGYLSEHPEAQAEVDALGAIAGLLALAPQEYEPSPELGRNLLSRIEGSDATKAAEAPPRRAGSRGRSGLFGLGGLAATAVAAAAVLAVVRLFPWNNSLHDENEDLLAEDEDLAGELETRQTYALPGSGTAKSVRGEVIEVREDRAVLMAENPPPHRRARFTRRGCCAGASRNRPASSSPVTRARPQRLSRAPSMGPKSWR